MELKEIKTIHDVILAWNNRQYLIDNTGQVFAIECVQLIPNVGYKVMYQAGNNRYAMTFNDEFCKAFKIILAINVDKEDFTSTNYIKQNNKEDKMEDFVKRMIVEHKELCERIDKLDAFVHNVDTPKNVHPVEYANLCIQLRGMKMYEDALRARLHNQGVEVDGDNYYATIKVEDEEESAIDND